MRYTLESSEEEEEEEEDKVEEGEETVLVGKISSSQFALCKLNVPSL